MVELSKILTNTAFAYYDEALFLHELTTFQVKTHINKSKAFGVLRSIENHYVNDQTGKLRTLQDLTIIIRAEQDLEDELREQKRDKPMILPLTTENLIKTLERKQRDFQQCKNVDDFSIGRGSAPRLCTLEPRSPGKSPGQPPSTDSYHDPKVLFQHTKEMLVAIAKPKAPQMQEKLIISPEKSTSSEPSCHLRDIIPQETRREQITDFSETTEGSVKRPERSHRTVEPRTSKKEKSEYFFY